MAHGHVFGGSVADTKVISEDRGVVVENWFVTRGDHKVTYIVKLTPSPQGGTDINVTLPEEDQKK
jgi:hypothetical protein